MKSIVAVLAVVAALLTGCQSPAAEPPSTVGALPIDSVATTLLPDVVISYVPDDTLPPGTLFDGQPCTALTADDFARVTIAGAGTARLVATVELADDVCGFDVRAGGSDYTIVLRARTADEFGRPATTDEEREALTGIGLAAVGIPRADDTFEVFVSVDNGYFSVTTPDRDSARALARAAAERSG